MSYAYKPYSPPWKPQATTNYTNAARSQYVTRQGDAWTPGSKTVGSTSQKGGGGGDVAGAVISAAISGYFGDRASKRETKANAAIAAKSDQNQVYMASLQRQWELVDRRYAQDSFNSFAKFATKDLGPAGPMIDPNSITPVDPYGGKGGGVRGGTSMTGNAVTAGSPNPTGSSTAPGARPIQQTKSPTWRAGA